MSKYLLFIFVKYTVKTQLECGWNIFYYICIYLFTTTKLLNMNFSILVSLSWSQKIYLYTFDFNDHIGWRANKPYHSKSGFISAKLYLLEKLFIYLTGAQV